MQKQPEPKESPRKEPLRRAHDMNPREDRMDDEANRKGKAKRRNDDVERPQ